MTDIIVLPSGVNLPPHRCKKCYAGMEIANAPRPLKALRCPRCLIPTKLYFCVSKTEPLEAFWNDECQSGVTMSDFARERLGTRAPLYGFPVAVPG